MLPKLVSYAYLKSFIFVYIQLVESLTSVEAGAVFLKE